MTPDEMAVQYEGCIMLLRRTVWDFISYTGLPKHEYDEQFSKANLYFMLACKSYDSDKSKFSTWVVIQVWGRLLKDLSKTRFQKNKTNGNNLLSFNETIADTRYPTARRPNRRFIEMVDELGSDGLALLMLVRSGELDIERLLKGHRNGVKTVFRFLRERGWSRVEIHRSFKEIARLLKE